MSGVAGRSGRTPKRSEERRGHRTQAEKDRAAVQKVTVDGVVAQPPADAAWHQLACEWYESLAESGQAIFFEPSDWAAARYCAAVMTRNLESPRFNAQLFGSLWSAMNDLMTTEASRRRLRLELERAPQDSGAKAASVLAEYRMKIA